MREGWKIEDSSRAPVRFHVQTNILHGVLVRYHLVCLWGRRGYALQNPPLLRFVVLSVVVVFVSFSLPPFPPLLLSPLQLFS